MRVFPFACRHPPGEVVAVKRGVRVGAYESVLDFHPLTIIDDPGTQASALRLPGCYLPAGMRGKIRLIASRMTMNKVPRFILCSYALPPSVNCRRQSWDAIDTGFYLPPSNSFNARRA